MSSQKSLKNKILEIFDVYYSENTSVKSIVRELNRNGKFDIKKTIEVLFLLAEEIEALKSEQK